MTFSIQALDSIYRRTTGYCHICGKKLARHNYGSVGTRGAWEVEHSLPRSRGGTDHMNNLFASCIPCNREKGNASTRTARARNGKRRAPLSPGKREEAKFQNGLAGAIVGGLIGMIGGPVGVVVGTLMGGSIGSNQNPDRG